MHESNTSQEQAKLGQIELARLGHLATQENMSPAAEVTVTQVEGGLSLPIEGVSLGMKVDQQGRNAGYVDKHETPVPEAGIAFGVEQASYGYTGIFTKAMTGYKVETAVHDPATNELTWKGNTNPNGDLKVTQDWGNAEQTGFLGVDAKDLANDGTRIGIIRVTGPDETVRTYALGADFVGEPDKWQVHGAIAEVELASAPELNETPRPLMVEGSHDIDK